MKNKENKIYVFDVGNTLIDKPSNRMVPELVDDLFALQERGNIIGVATMRNMAMLNELLAQVNFDFIIALNGAYVECKNVTIFDKPIDCNELAPITISLDSSKIEYVLYSKINVHTSIIQNENIYGIELKHCSDVIQSLKMDFPLFTFHVWEEGITCDIHSINVSKGKGMQEVCRYFNIPLQNSIAFGDGFNDAELFRLCGISIAMGTSPEELKSLATFVTKSVNENGVSWALNKFKI